MKTKEKPPSSPKSIKEDKSASVKQYTTGPANTVLLYQILKRL